MHQTKVLVAIACLTMTLSSGLPIRAADTVSKTDVTSRKSPAHKQSVPAQDNPKKVDALIRQLGSASFKQREKAGKQILTFGAKAIPALERGCRSMDVEIRARCQRLLRLIKSATLESRLDQFTRHGPQKGHAPFEGWERFQKIFGRDRSARSLFVEIYKKERAILQLAATNPKAAAKKFGRWQKKINARGYKTSYKNFQDKGTTLPVEIVVLVYVLHCDMANWDANTHKAACECLAQFEVLRLAKANPLLARAIGKTLQHRRMHKQMFWWWYLKVQKVGAPKPIEDALKNDLRLQLEEGVKSNVFLILNAASFVKGLGYTEHFQKQGRAAIGAVVRSIEKKKKPSFYALHCLVEAADKLNLKDVHKQVLKPAATKEIRKLPRKGAELSPVLRSVVKELGLMKELVAHVSPGLYTDILAALQKPTKEKIRELLKRGEELGIKGIVQSLLSPASLQLSR